jgi:hypothetical protein
MNAPIDQRPMADPLPNVVARRIFQKLTDVQRRALIQFILERCTFHGGRAMPTRGTIGAGADQCTVYFRTLSVIRAFFDLTANKSCVGFWYKSLQNDNTVEIGWVAPLRSATPIDTDTTTTSIYHYK